MVCLLPGHVLPATSSADEWESAGSGPSQHHHWICESRFHCLSTVIGLQTERVQGRGGWRREMLPWKVVLLSLNVNLLSILCLFWLLLFSFFHLLYISSVSTFILLWFLSVLVCYYYYSPSPVPTTTPHPPPNLKLQGCFSWAGSPGAVLLCQQPGAQRSAADVPRPLPGPAVSRGEPSWDWSHWCEWPPNKLSMSSVWVLPESTYICRAKWKLAHPREQHTVSGFCLDTSHSAWRAV